MNHQNKRLASSAQLTRLRDWYAHSIGWRSAMWYVHRLKTQEMTMAEASAEMDRLAELRAAHGQTTMKPKDWDEICPDPAEVADFMKDLTKPKEG